MTVYRIPTEKEDVFIRDTYRPYEGHVFVLESTGGGTIAVSLSRWDLEQYATEKQLTVRCHKPSHWDEPSINCPLCDPHERI